MERIHYGLGKHNIKNTYFTRYLTCMKCNVLVMADTKSKGAAHKLRNTFGVGWRIRIFSIFYLGIDGCKLV